MLDKLPAYISITFGLTTMAALILFVITVRKSSHENTRMNVVFIATGLAGWLLLQAMLTIKNVYNTGTNSLPPKILLFGILPVMLTVLFLFVTQKGKAFVDSLPLKELTYLNTVRIPVEFVLFWLYLNKAVPQLMTFEGYNFDIIAGITAPFIAYVGFAKKKLNRQILLIWNILCLLLLLNIVVLAFLSAPSPLQKLAFEQPNIAILHFPFSWLPTFIVPVVLFGHLVSIRRLAAKNDQLICVL